MVQVRFNLRSNKERDSHIQLVYRIAGDNKKIVIGTNLHVPDKFWNIRTMSVRETIAFPDCGLNNTLHDNWESAANDTVKDFLLIGKTPSRVEFRNTVLVFTILFHFGLKTYN